MAPVREMASSLIFASLLFSVANGEHHMKYKVQKRQNAETNIPLILTNQCREAIHPGILTQAGTGPDNSGFKLSAGDNYTLHVAQDWQGRVWGRTNCSFNDDGQPKDQGRQCSTGDCGPFLQCKGAGENPATLAEFTLSGANSQSYYDISLVDGYNLPMAIVMLANGDDIPRNQTNPSCVGSIGDLGPADYDPYTTSSDMHLGTNSSNKLPFSSPSASTVSSWCPWDLQVSPPQGPGAGVYPYPDSDVKRPSFNPCFSACAKYNEPAYCCTGKYDGPRKCSSNYYSKAAKDVCPDAYSYPYDDQDSTFSVPEGPGFHVIFCPGGLSTNIIASKKSSGNGQQKSHASGAKFNVFRDILVLTDGMALKVVVFGSLMLALLA